MHLPLETLLSPKVGYSDGSDNGYYEGGGDGSDGGADGYYDGGDDDDGCDGGGDDGYNDGGYDGASDDDVTELWVEKLSDTENDNLCEQINNVEKDIPDRTLQDTFNTKYSCRLANIAGYLARGYWVPS